MQNNFFIPKITASIEEWRRFIVNYTDQADHFLEQKENILQLMDQHIFDTNDLEWFELLHEYIRLEHLKEIDSDRWLSRHFKGGEGRRDVMILLKYLAKDVQYAEWVLECEKRMDFFVKNNKDGSMTWWGEFKTELKKRNAKMAD